MSQTEKKAYWDALKERGVTFDQHYRNYTTEVLKDAYVKLTGGQLVQQPQAAVAAALVKQAPPAVPTRGPDPNEFAGQRLNTNPGNLEPLRTDENGRIWYQEEVRKKAFAAPRGRRKITYTERGTEETTVAEAGVGQFTETFEVEGSGPGRTAEAKITLPSYQVGIYKDRRFPFLVHTYANQVGFDLFQVQEFYGGAELVPAECKKKYVENVLCYDVRTVIQAIQREDRQLQLAGRII